MGSDAVRSARMQRVEDALVPICGRFNVTRAEVLGRGQSAIVSRARHELMAQLWRSGLAAAEVARILERDHTTVLVGIQRVVGPDEYRAELKRRRAIGRVSGFSPMKAACEPHELLVVA